MLEFLLQTRGEQVCNIGMKLTKNVPPKENIPLLLQKNSPLDFPHTFSPIFSSCPWKLHNLRFWTSLTLQRGSDGLKKVLCGVCSLQRVGEMGGGFCLWLHIKMVFPTPLSYLGPQGHGAHHFSDEQEPPPLKPVKASNGEG